MRDIDKTKAQLTNELRELRKRIAELEISEAERKQLKKKIIKYVELDQLKSNLISTVSHELRTPLASIKGYTTMMLDYDHRLQHSEKRQYLHSIDRATNRLTKLIEHLLDTSMLEAGLLRLEKKPISI